MRIKEKTSYHVDGREFSHITKVKEHITNEIGKIIDTINPRLPPKEALKLLDALVLNRNRLTTLLQTSYDKSTDPIYSDDVSVFDL